MGQLTQSLRENLPKSFPSDIEKPEEMHGSNTKKWERAG